MNNDPRLSEYIELLKAFNEHTNIYSKGAYHHLSFHITDSLSLASLINDGNTIADFGSGSGLPAIPLAIALPKSRVIAVESKSRKRRFLESAKTSLNLANLTIYEGDVQQFIKDNHQHIHVVTAKAFAPKEKVLSYAKKLSPKPLFMIIPVSQNQVDQMEYQDQDRIIVKEAANTRYLYYKREITAE